MEKFGGNTSLQFTVNIMFLKREYVDGSGQGSEGRGSGGASDVFTSASQTMTTVQFGRYPVLSRTCSHTKDSITAVFVCS